LETARPHILFVEDDPKLGRQVQASLDQAGFRVDWRQDGSQALEADPAVYQLIVLDLMLPGTYGLDILKAVRAAGSDVPVLVLSAKTDAAVKVRAFELGADDYLTKPFWPEELLARVQARLRRPLASTDGRLEVGTLALDPQARRAWAAGVPLELTRAEFDLLAALARRPGAAIERGWLAEHVLDPEREGSGRTLDVHVSRLRKKLGVLADRVETVWGVGYRLRVPE
jgi:two-component system response regulator MtrA